MKSHDQIKHARAIILRRVSNWDPLVLDCAAEFAVDGGNPHDFDGRPHDEHEMKAFAMAFQEIQQPATR